MKVEFVLFIFFAAVLGPVVITIVYCGFRGCGDGEEAGQSNSPGKKRSEEQIEEQEQGVNPNQNKH
ncbi:MAG: hypothetical protein Q7K29_04005 [Thermoleophilia bacterium]|nr:hypothetical protein [Thermoleophilia bacterium]